MCTLPRESLKTGYILVVEVTSTADADTLLSGERPGDFSPEGGPLFFLRQTHPIRIHIKIVYTFLFSPGTTFHASDG